MVHGVGAGVVRVRDFLGKGWVEVASTQTGGYALPHMPTHTRTRTRLLILSFSHTISVYTVKQGKGERSVEGGWAEHEGCAFTMTRIGVQGDGVRCTCEKMDCLPPLPYG